MLISNQSKSDQTTNNSVIMHNATFWYGEDAHPTEGWMEITGKHITQFKAGKLPQALKSEKTIDLNRAHVLPGFVDCHTHLTVSAWIPCSIDGSNWRCKKDLLEAINRHAQILDRSAWLVVFYADFHRIGRLPTMLELDEATQGRPIIINDFSLHQCLANESAFQQANISSIKFSQGDVEMKHGRATGRLQELASGHMLSIALTRFAEQFESLNILALLEAEADRHIALGITACHDPCVHPKLQNAMEKLEKRSPLRLSWSHVKSHEQADFISEELCLSCGTGPKSAKMFLDGAQQCAICINPADVMKLSVYAIGNALQGNFSSLRTLTDTKLNYKKGQFYSPYLRHDQDSLNHSLEAIGKQNVRPKIHAIGNEAVKCACSALKQSGTSDSTIEHLIFLSDQNIDEVASCGAIASLQPGFISQSEELKNSNIDKVLNIIPAKSLLKSGIPTALSSDNPCGPLNPLGNIRYAVTRQTSSGLVIDAKESISLQEAIKAYSMGGHHAIHGQPHKGLTEGQVADLTILNGSPENPNVQVISTWIDGKQVFSKTAGTVRNSL